MAAPLPAGFRRIFRRELREMASRPSLLFMLGPYPLLLFLLLACIFGAGLPTNLPVAVVDQDGSQTSREIVRMLDETSDLVVEAKLPNLTEAKQALLQGRVYGIVQIPQNTERDLLAGSRPEVAIFYNNQFLTAGGIVGRAAASVLGTYSAGVSVALREAQGQHEEEAEAALSPVPVQQSALFNPSLDYTQFLLASVMPTILQIFICAAIALTFSWDQSTPNGLRRLMIAGKSPLRVICGKLLPYGLTYVFTLWLADAIIFGYFGAPFRGNLMFHLLYSVVFVTGCLCLGGLIAMISTSGLGALGIVGLLTGPAFGFAGVSFPRHSMNAFSRFWGDMLPLTSYLRLRTDQAVRGAWVEISLPMLGWSSLLALIYGGLFLYFFSKRAKAAIAAPAGLAQSAEAAS